MAENIEYDTDKEISKNYDLNDIINNQQEDTDNKDEISMEKFDETSISDYDRFDKKCYNKGNGYKIPHFPEIEKKLEGVESGLYVFSGESNSGKSAIMMNILKDMATYGPNKLFGIYYSLDDSKDEIIARIISMDEMIPISVSSKPMRYENLIKDCDNDNAQIYEDFLKKRKHGLQTLKDQSKQFKIEDSDKITNSTDLINHMMQLQTYVKTIDPEMNIIVAIDSINDIQLDRKKYKKLDKLSESEEVAKLVKSLTVKFDIPIFVSSHLRKLNGNRRPTLDDLRDANTLVYESSLIWLVYNDVSKNKNAANIFWDDKTVESGLGAIIELDWAKNKKSSYKGRTFNKFQPNFSKCTECTTDEMKYFENMIYEN